MMVSLSLSKHKVVTLIDLKLLAKISKYSRQNVGKTGKYP